MSDLHNISTAETTFAAESSGSVGLLTVRGTLDFTTHEPATEFFDKAFAQFGPHLVVNLLELDFLDSRATGLLVNCWKRALDGGGWLGLVAVEQGAARALWITGLASHVPVFPTVADALAAAPSRDAE
ncbi:STAS domain-containing protein [Microbispora sp. KK1-11]|uniref:STAS domain-containing protein n=1 Tax=Microbispora sp. KK1-11 TaxID=2053005 RepID=UPI0011597E37|nr:STAS domain-containing protein [Microbispora sp. KK1-11]TQS25214.1 STAS domain-containing protein [Microbispora sp. KK1-11]